MLYRKEGVKAFDWNKASPPIVIFRTDDLKKGVISKLNGDAQRDKITGIIFFNESLPVTGAIELLKAGK